MLLYGSLFVAWSGCNRLGYHPQHLEKHARPKDTYAWLIKKFVTNQDCIFIIQNISFSKILCNPKFINWHSFLFLKKSCDTLDLKSNIKWNSSNIHIVVDPYKYWPYVWEEPAVSYTWTGWSSRLQESDWSFKREFYRIYLLIWIKQNRKMSTCNRLDL